MAPICVVVLDRLCCTHIFHSKRYVPSRAADGSKTVASRMDRCAVRYLHPTCDMFTGTLDGVDSGLGFHDIYDILHDKRTVVNACDLVAMAGGYYQRAVMQAIRYV